MVRTVGITLLALFGFAIPSFSAGQTSNLALDLWTTGETDYVETYNSNMVAIDQAIVTTVTAVSSSTFAALEADINSSTDTLRVNVDTNTAQLLLVADSTTTLDTSTTSLQAQVDALSGGALLTSTQTFTAPNTFASSFTVSGFALGFWHTVASITVSGVTEVDFEGLDPSKTYRVTYNFFLNTTDSQFHVRFSTATGVFTEDSIYEWINQIQLFAASVINGDSSAGGDNKITTIFFARNIDSENAWRGSFEFGTYRGSSATNRNTFLNGHQIVRDSGLDFAHYQFGGTYTPGAGTLQGVRMFVTGGGDFDGYAHIQELR